MPPEDRPPSYVTALLLRYRVWIVALAALLLVAGSYRTALTYSALRSDLEELLPESAASVTALRELRARLPGIRHLGVVVAVDRPEHMPAAERFIDALAERIRAYPSRLVGSVRTDFRAEREFAERRALTLMDAEDVERLREAVERRRDWDVSRTMGLDLEDSAENPRPELPIAQLRAKYEARYGKLSSDHGDRFSDGKSIALLIQTASHATGEGADSELLERVRADVASLGFPAAFAPELRLGYAGDIASRVEEARGLETDLTLSSLVAMLLIAGSLVWFYRSWQALWILGIPLVIGTVSAFLLVAAPPWSIRYLNTNTAFLGSIVVGNGVNSGIMLLARFQEERQAGASLVAAIDRALVGTWKATLAASAAAAVAYGSLVFTDFRGFNQFGWIGSVGSMTCWLASYTLSPVLASWLGGSIGAPSQQVSSAGPTSWLTRVTLGRPRLVLGVTAALCVVATLGLVRRAGDAIEYDLSTLRRRDSFVDGERYWGKRMDAAIGRYLTPTVILAKSPEEAAVIAARVEALAKSGGGGDLVASVRHAGMFVSAERDRAVEEARKLALVTTPRLLAELAPPDRKLVESALSAPALAPLRLAEIPPSLLAGLRERDGRIDRNVLVFPKLTGGTWNAQLLDEYAHDLRHAATVGDAARPVAGSLLLSSDIARTLRSDGPRATWLALGLVLLCCALAFQARARGRAGNEAGPVAYSLTAVASLLVGALLMTGLLAWQGQRINFCNFVALPITFGIAADYSINVLERYQTDSRGPRSAALANALAHTSGAVALCSATTVIGFGSLLMAQNQALFSFGVFAVVGELTCLATAVIALPAVLVVWQRRGSFGGRAEPGQPTAARR